MNLKLDNIQANFHSQGASLCSLLVNGQSVLRSIPIKSYPFSSGHFGSIAGPIANRVAHAQVQLNNQIYHLPINEHGQHTLHGGDQGLGRRPWQCTKQSDTSIEFQINLEDGELGLPGFRTFSCEYSLFSTLPTDIFIDHSSFSELNRSTYLSEVYLKIELTMSSDRDTFCNLAFHPYFCLDNSGGLLHHHLHILSKDYLPLDSYNIPTGNIAPVKDTEFDFTRSRPLAELIQANALSLDHNFCFFHEESPSTIPKSKQLYPLAQLTSLLSKLELQVYSDQVGLQVYCPSHLDQMLNDDLPKDYFPAICLEPQSWPAAPNYSHFPSILVTKSQPYQQKTLLKLSLME